MGLRESILGANDVVSAPCEVKEWNCTVFIKTWTTAERQSVIAYRDGANKVKLPAYIVVKSLVDPQNQPVFTEADVDALMSKSGAVVERVAAVALKHNGVGDSAVEDAKKN